MRRLAFSIRVLALLLVSTLPLFAPSYNMAAPELEVLTTWLYEPHGYLDFACRVSDGRCGRQAWELDNALDFVQWIRENPQIDPESSTEAQMVWWIVENDQVNIQPPNRPPESPAWVTILEGWDASIDAGFARVPQGARNSTSINMYVETSCPVGWKSGDDSLACSVSGSIPAGAHLAHQKNIISKVLGIL